MKNNLVFFPDFRKNPLNLDILEKNWKNTEAVIRYRPFLSLLFFRIQTLSFIEGPSLFLIKEPFLYLITANPVSWKTLEKFRGGYTAQALFIIVIYFFQIQTLSLIEGPSLYLIWNLLVPYKRTPCIRKICSLRFVTLLSVVYLRLRIMEKCKIYEDKC